MIEHFYDSLLEVYQKRVNDSKLNSSEVGKVNFNIKRLNTELEGLLRELNKNRSHNEGTEVKKVIRKICLLDLKTILDKQKSEIYSILENRQDNPVDISIDESRLY